MKNLQAYIQEQNSWTAFFNTPAINFPLSQTHVNTLACSIDSKLSPENLHCDGEISNAQAQRKYRKLIKVVSELEAYCRTNSLTMPTMYEVY